MEFKEGDIVQLKSGGPAMVISSMISETDTYYSPGDLSCIWFSDKVEGHIFNPLVLKPYDVKDDTSK